jgi:hypothetical protein
MNQVGFEPTIPVFEWAKTVHALDRVATAIGITILYQYKIFSLVIKELLILTETLASQPSSLSLLLLLSLSLSSLSCG